MTDIESDTSNNVFNFQNVNTTINAKGPNTNFSCRNPTSVYNMSRNYEQPRYAESAYDQRSIYYRRETLPMSTQSAFDVRPRNFQHYGGMSSLQLNGRSGSPMSMRSIDSCVSAADIALAIKNGKFNKNDLKVIRDASQKLLKQRVRKRIEKKRNMKLLSKGRRRSGDDSGHQASDSSVSSDDYRSVKTYKENMSSSRSARMDLPDFRKNIEDRNRLKDSSDNFSLNNFKNKFTIGSSSVNNTQNFNSTANSNRFNTMPTQKDRFRNGFLLPSQRFNRSVASSAILENAEQPHKNKENNQLSNVRNHYAQNNHIKNNCPSGSEEASQNFNSTANFNRFNTMPTQKDRFRNGFLLPSQRFNRSVASSAILENAVQPHKNKENNQLSNVRNHYAQNNHIKNNCPSGSEEEEIFSEITVTEKSTFNIDSLSKRHLDSEDESILPVSKKSRITSPAKSAPYNKRAPPKLKNIHPCNNNVELSNSFEFAKPALPVRKSKPRVQEKLIAKSAQLLTDFSEPIRNKIQENVKILQPSNLQEKSNDYLTQLDQSETTQNSDLSSRPSFIKRKLFTQNLDVAEKANLCTDATNSPQSSGYSVQKEKNKSRKLVTNQSCLNREVEDDNNLLDLIHKIVPPDRMNLTNQTTINQNKNDVNNKNKKDNDAKWDVTSVISICNEDDVSDTYTDEEIFNAHNTVKLTAKNKDINPKAKPIDKLVAKTQILQDCYVLLEINNTLPKQVVNQNPTHNNDTKSNDKSFVKTFWDTDFESDAECQTVLPRSHVTDIFKKDDTKKNAKSFWDTDFESDAECQTVLPQSHVMDIIKKANATLDTARSEISKKSPDVPKHLNNSLMNNTVNTFNSMRKLNTSTLNVKSHRTSKKKKCCNETCATKSKLDTTVDIKKDNYEVPAENNVGMINSKTKVIQSKKSTAIPKSKSNKQNEKNSTVVKSTTQSKKSPKEKKLIKDKKAVSPKNKPKSESKSKSEKASSVNNKKPKAEVKNNKTNLNLNNTVDPIQNTSFISGRPIRSCRTRNQSRSIELSGSAQLNNTSVSINRRLRSRVINLSSSIENITIKIKPKNKSNKTISQMNTRKSDVSFSIWSKEQTPVPKKTSAQSRAHSFKGKRK